MNQNIKIRKAKITKKGTLEVSYDEIINNGNSTVINKLSLVDGHKAHADLKTAFAALNVHMAIITEQVRTKDDSKKVIARDLVHKDDALILEAIKVNAIAIGGDDQEGVCLIGSRDLLTGNPLNIVSPFTKYFESNYLFAEELMQDVQVVISEVHEYLEGKHAPDAQLELELAAETEFFEQD